MGGRHPNNHLWWQSRTGSAYISVIEKPKEERDAREKEREKADTVPFGFSRVLPQPEPESAPEPDDCAFEGQGL